VTNSVSGAFDASVARLKTRCRPARQQWNGPTPRSIGADLRRVLTRQSFTRACRDRRVRRACRARGLIAFVVGAHKHQIASMERDAPKTFHITTAGRPWLGPAGRDRGKLARPDRAVVLCLWETDAQ